MMRVWPSAERYFTLFFCCSFFALRAKNEQQNGNNHAAAGEKTPDEPTAYVPREYNEQRIDANIHHRRYPRPVREADRPAARRRSDRTEPGMVGRKRSGMVHGRF